MRTHPAPPAEAFVQGGLLSNVTNDVNTLWENVIFVLTPTKRSPHPIYLFLRQICQIYNREAPTSRETAGSVYVEDALFMPRLHRVPDSVPLLGYHTRATAVLRPSPPRGPKIPGMPQPLRATRYISNHKPPVRLLHQGDGGGGGGGGGAHFM